MPVNLHVNVERTTNGTTALVTTSNPDTTAAVWLSVNEALDKMGVDYSSYINDGQGLSVEYKGSSPFEVFKTLLSEPTELGPLAQKLYWSASEDVITIGLDFELEDEPFIEHVLRSSPW